MAKLLVLVCLGAMIYLAAGRRFRPLKSVSPRQSPMDIIGTTYRRLPRLNFRGFDKGVTGLEIGFDDLRVYVPGKANGMSVTGGGFVGTYHPFVFHLHYDLDGFGSEHTLNGEFFPIEMHYLTLKSDFNSMEEGLASGQRDAFGVHTFFVTEGPRDNPGWENLLQGITNLQNAPGGMSNSSVPIPGEIVAEDLLDNGERNFGHYYRTFGSMTGEPHAEIVSYAFYEKPIRISKRQFDIIRKSVGPDGHPLSHNRRIQSVNHRPVYVTSRRLLKCYGRGGSSS